MCGCAWDQRKLAPKWASQAVCSLSTSPAPGLAVGKPVPPFPIPSRATSAFLSCTQIHCSPACSLADSHLKLCLRRLSSPGSSSFPVPQQTLMPLYLLLPVPPPPGAPGQPGLAWHPVPLQVPTKVMGAKSEPWDLMGPDWEAGLIAAIFERTLTY